MINLLKSKYFAVKDKETSHYKTKTQATIIDKLKQQNKIPLLLITFPLRTTPPYYLQYIGLSLISSRGIYSM